jgi:hypothetical protein
MNPPSHVAAQPMKEDNAWLVWTCCSCVLICEVISVTELVCALDNLTCVTLASHGPDSLAVEAGGAA